MLNLKIILLFILLFAGCTSTEPPRHLKTFVISYNGIARDTIIADRTRIEGRGIYLFREDELVGAVKFNGKNTTVTIHAIKWH